MNDQESLILNAQEMPAPPPSRYFTSAQARALTGESSTPATMTRPFSFSPLFILDPDLTSVHFAALAAFRYSLSRSSCRLNRRLESIWSAGPAVG